MPVLLTALAAGSLALVPPADVRVADAHTGAAPASRSPATPIKDCARQLDPSFVHFVAPAAGSEGNPLLRLIASPPLAGRATLVSPLRPMSSCEVTPLLTRNDRRP